MTEASELLRNDYEQATQGNKSLFIIIGRLSTIGLIFFVLLHVILVQYDAGYPWLPLTLINIISSICVIFSIRIYKQDKYSAALGLYVGAVALSVAVNLYLFGGPQSPLMKAFIVLVLISGLLGNHKLARWLFFGVVIIIISQLILFEFGLIPSTNIRNETIIVLDNVVLLVVLFVTLALTTRIIRNNKIVVKVLQQRDQQLTNAIQTSENALQNEQQFRQMQQLLIEQLQHLVQSYMTYLDQVETGNINANIIFPEDQTTDVPELFILGEKLRSTITKLISRIEDTELALSKYVQSSWESYVSESEKTLGYVYDGQQRTVKSNPQVLTSVMKTALKENGLATEGGELGISMNINGAVIGALGLKRSIGSTWSEDEIIMVEDIVGQLAQTVERLRLVDDISQRAALESAVGDISSRIRAEVDIELILKRALTELGEAVQADRGFVQLSVTDSTGEMDLSDVLPEGGPR
jgi:GAF domain-containing protein